MSTNKELKQELVHLQKIVYQRELSAALELLYTEFKNWKEDILTAEELNRKLYEYQKGPAKELFLKYERPSFADINIASAVINNILKRSEISDKLLPIIDSKIKVLNGM